MTSTKDFIISTAVKYFSQAKDDIPIDQDNEILEMFINESQMLTLCIVLRQQKIEFQKEVTYENAGALIFYKTKQTSLEGQDSITNLGITALPENPVESLYLSLRHIYGPLLQAVTKVTSFSMDPKIQETIMYLEGSLRTFAHGRDGGPSLLVLLTVDDELQYWQRITEETKAYKQKEMADAFVSILKLLSQEMRFMDSCDVTEVKETMENSSGLLDDLWRHSSFVYPGKRMSHLMDVIGNTCMKKLQDVLAATRIWSDDPNAMTTISNAIDGAEAWIKSCYTLTQKYWPNHSLHIWEGPLYTPRLLKKFYDRLKEVADVRSIHMQLGKLLSHSEQKELNLNEMFTSFEGIVIWQCTPQNDATWMKAKSVFEKKLKPAEELIAQKLHARLNNLSANQMLYEFNKYATLIERSSILMVLLKERQVLISFVGQLLKDIENQIGVEKISKENEFIIPGISSMVQQIQWTKRMDGKVIQIQKIVERLLIDLDESDEILSYAGEIKIRLADQQNQLFEDWTRDLQAEIMNESLTLSSNTPVVEFYGENNFMRVTFNPRLVTLERDVRHMATLGFSIPSNVKEIVNNASKFMEHARSLQQVAAFHNTQGERMIVSQRPMMLNAAIQLASLVKEQTAVSWKETHLVGKYVEKLKSAIDNLAKQNLYLSSQHVILRNIVVSLMDTNLLQKQSEWKKAIRQMRDIVDKVESNGYTNTKSWMIHWDIQLYKALEHQYRSALIDPLSHLPVMKVELIFRQQGIHLQPPLEDIRASCHTYLKKLLALPLNFVGLQNIHTNKESPFASIMLRNNWMIAGAMSEIECTLEKVLDIIQKWKKWGALGSIDLDNLCDIHLSHPSDWENNFKDCKSLGQTIAKLPMDEERVDWIWISSASLRNDLEIHNRRYWIALTTSLQSSFQRDIASIEAFFLMAHNTMNQNVPKTPKELGTANEEFYILKEKQPQMIALFEGLRRKQNMVRTWCGERVRSLEHLSKQWENTLSQMQNYEKLIVHQAESVKSNLLGEWSNLGENLEVWHTRWSQNKPKSEQLTQNSFSDLHAKYKIFEEALENWNTFKTDKENMTNECTKFNITLEENQAWIKIEKAISEDMNLWGPFQKFTEELNSFGDQEWIIFQKKLHLLEDFILEWSQKLEPFTPITLFIRNEIDTYKEIIPVLKSVRSANFTEKHWREVYSLLEIPAKPPTSLILNDFLNVATNIKKNTKSLQKIWISASHEAIVREAVAELELWLAGTKFTLTKHTDSKQQHVFIIKDFKDILTKVEEYQNLAGSARAAGDMQNGDNTTDQLSLWETRLSQMKTAITSLSHIQRKWIYLEPILLGEATHNGGSINSDIFIRLDRDFRHIMRVVESDPRLSALMNIPSLNSLLMRLVNQLVQCQNTLEQYMAEKRSVFPRFYFLSDDDLLELLGQARANSINRESVLQTHIKKLFPGIVGVQLGPGAVSITAMKGQDDDKLAMDTPIDIEAPIEVWLSRLEVQMRESLHTNIKQCLLHLELQKHNLTNYPTQVLCLVQSIHFTENTERAISSHNLHGMKNSIREELNKYLKVDIQETDGNLEKSKLQALILQCYHHLQILNELINNGTSSLNKWHWQKQLRFYVESKTSICACMGLAKLPYTYEYLGTNIGTLVRTELTDQCFLTLTQALHLGMVGNPFGPAGTGKTESVKALGGLLGRLVLVFNCDEGMDKMTMGRLLSGLALCGAWGCFDEFNRLEETTLSAVAQQFSSILEAINHKNQQPSAILNGKEVKVCVGCGVFATMNPAGANYGGRRKLPEGLNRLFRPCAMCQPHVVHIASALLAAQGYTKSEEIAEKLVLCFDMAKSLLSENHHYDWGLRALKTIIGSCGTALKDAVASSESYPDDVHQISLIVQALRVNTLSKLSHLDYKRFESILEVIFTGAKNVDVVSSNLAEALKDCCESKNFNINENQIRKCAELYNQLKQRMGIVIVGPPGSGKTFLRNVLKDALIKLGNNISQHVICPKAMSRKDLLGYIDSDTRQWCDGVISTVSLEVANQPSDVWSWVICDGDVDPEWIESLNSVLDDNRLLTLPSGWRIQFGKNVNFIFETHDLKFASPATITRMGIILLSDEGSCYKELIQNWYRNLSNNDGVNVLDDSVFQETIEKVINWAEKNPNNFLVPYYRIPLTKQILSFLEDYDGIKSIEEHLAVAILKGTSCFIKPEALEDFLEQVSQWTNVSSHAIICDTGIIRDSDYEPVSIGNDYFLMNKRIMKIVGLTETWMNSNQHFMIFGPPSSGKSMILDYLFKDGSDRIVINLKCTPIFDIQHIIQTLRQKSAVNSGNGKGGGRLVLVMKSLQRSLSDKWNSSVVQSFLLQLIHYGGFWQKSDGTGTDGKMQWFTLQPFTLIVTATVEDGGLKLSPRLTNSLRIINLTAPDEKELSEMCDIYLNSSLMKCNLKSDEKAKLMQFSPKMFSLFQDVTKTFFNEIHYKWTSRDIIQWCQNLCFYKANDANTMCRAIIEEASCIFKERLISDNERNAFDTLIQRHIGSISSLELLFLSKIGNAGFQLELIDDNEYSLSINKTINQCNSEVENGYSVFGENGVELCGELKRLVAMGSRILSTARGAIVFVGVAGVGRRAAAKISAEMINAKFISISNAYQFTNNLRNILISCGSECVNTVVVLEESAASDNNVLGVVEALLSKGENASSLSFYAQEIEAMISQMKTKNNELKTVEIFLQNIRKHLGIILIFDAKQYNLKSLFSSYPILYNRCQLFWLDQWSDYTLKNISVLVTKRMISGEQGLNDCLNIISSGKTVEMFSSIEREDLKTPYRYMLFMKTYFNIYFEKKQFLEEKRKRLQAGVSALTEAQDEVTRLKAGAAEQEKILAEKQTLANQALNQIGTTMQSASVHKQEMEILKRNTEKENFKLQERKKEIEVELSEVEPVIQEARTAVGDIKAESLSEVRSLRAPPEPVRDVLEGVLRLMGIADTSWHSMKTFLSKRGIKDDIKMFDASNISRESLIAVEKLLATHGNSFSEKTAKRASVACAPLAAWVLANVKYANVLQKISPLETEQRTLTRNLAVAESQIKDLSSNLNTVDERVAALKEELNTYTKQATEIEINLTSVQNTVEKAEKLVSRLSEEFARWNQNLFDLSKECADICIRSLIMAGFIVYLTHENEDEKYAIFQKWRKIFDDKIEYFDVKDFFLTRDNEITWVDSGLSSNSTSLCNGIIINEVLKDPKCGLVPLVIDPNNECIQWLSKVIEKNPKDIISQHDSKFVTVLQHAVRFGKILIVKDMTSIDDGWSPLLRGQVPSNLGISSVNPGFRLILFSQDSKFLNQLTIYHKSLISIVDFTPQKQGLTDQLIFHAVKQEQPELQKKMLEINTKKDKLLIQQEQLEVQLLSQLSSGNILHNPVLLESLEHTQKAVIEITVSLKEAAEVSSSIKDQCELYRPLALRIASSCLAISSLAHHYPLVNVTLSTAIGLFLKGLENFRGMMAKSDFNIESVGKYVVISLMERVLVALNKEFHSTALLYLMRYIYPENIPQKEWEVIVSNPDTYIYSKSDDDFTKVIPEWLNMDRKPYLVALQILTAEFYSTLNLENENDWRKFITTGDWDSIPNPNKVTPFQKVLLAWTLKPSKLSLFFTKVTSQILGTNQLYPSGDLITTVEKWGSVNKPVLVVGAAGADPVDQIKARAMFKVGTNKYKQIWLSDNSTFDISENLMKEIKWVEEVEGWLVIIASAGNWNQNEIYRIFTELGTTSTESQARIWIVVESSSIPYQLASCCINVIVEAPTGIKNNLLRTLSVWGSQQGITENKSINPKQTRLEFSLALAHSVIQQRCSYIPQGWRHQYEFSWGDVEASLIAVRETDRSIASGLCKSFYSGRISWEQDTLLMSALLDKHFDESVLGHAWKPLGIDLSLPMTTKLQDYIGALTNFPSSDNPALLSLPHNIQIMQEQVEANNALIHLKALTLKETVQEYNNKGLRKKLSPILSLWKKLNSGSQSLLKNKFDLQGDSTINGLRALAICECELANMAIQNVHADLVALHSLSVSSDERKRMLAFSLISDKTPESWLDYWSAGPSSASAFITGLCERATIAQKRILNKNDDNSSFTFPLSSFFKPKCIIYALLWQASQRLSAAPERLKPLYKWDDAEPDMSSGKVILTDLWLEGAVWEAGRLQPCRTDTAIQVKAPPISVCFVLKNSSEYTNKNQVEIPIFTSRERQDIVFKINAPSAEQFNKNIWVLNSTALIIS